MITLVSNKREFANLANESLKSLQTGRIYEYYFEEVKHSKTIKQLKFLFGGLISALQSYYLDTDGTEYDKELIKELLYQAVGINEEVILPNGQQISYRKSLSKMSKEEANNFINQCITWIDESTDCVLPIGLRYLWTTSITDEEIERLLSCKFNETDELYLRQLRKMHCLGCGKSATEVHHIRQGLYGKGIKNADYMAIPICYKCHRTLHDLGEQSFLNGIQNVTNGMNIELFCKLLYQKIRNSL